MIIAAMQDSRIGVAAILYSSLRRALSCINIGTIKSWLRLRIVVAKLLELPLGEDADADFVSIDPRPRE
jgi:hypothetical protein